MDPNRLAHWFCDLFFLELAARGQSRIDVASGDSIRNWIVAVEDYREGIARCAEERPDVDYDSDERLITILYRGGSWDSLSALWQQGLACGAEGQWPVLELRMPKRAARVLLEQSLSTARLGWIRRFVDLFTSRESLWPKLFAESLDENDCAFVVRCAFPVSHGHTLVFAKRAVASWFELSTHEQAEMLGLLDRQKAILERELQPDGWNIGINDGGAAGQTLDRVHIHLIPRFHGDVHNPLGGVRNVIPQRANYKDHPLEPLGPIVRRDLPPRPYLSASACARCRAHPAG